VWCRRMTGLMERYAEGRDLRIEVIA